MLFYWFRTEDICGETCTMDESCQGFTFDSSKMECKFGKLLENLKIPSDGLRVFAVKDTIPEKVPHIHVLARQSQIDDISLDGKNSSQVDHGRWMPINAPQTIVFSYKHGMSFAIFIIYITHILDSPRLCKLWWNFLINLLRLVLVFRVGIQN